MKRYLTQYYDSITGWQDVQLDTTKEDAQRTMSQYLLDHPWIKEVRIKSVMK